MTAQTLLVVVDENPEGVVALRYAAQRAALGKGRVAMLSVIEPQGIQEWGGVERAMDDEAFDRARAVQAKYIKLIQETTGHEPLFFFHKGEMSKVLFDLIEQEKDITCLVLAAKTRDGASNPLIQYLTSDKGLRKLSVPLVIVPETCRCREEMDMAQVTGSSNE